jgi:hypothetical protein
MRYLILGLTIMFVSACDGDADHDPEAELREWIARGELAAEEKDRGDLLALIAESYADSRGNDRDSLGNILRAYFFRQQTIALLTTIDEITLYDETAALINMTVGMAGTNSGALGFRADAYRFELELQKPDDEWKLIGARWGELGGELR